MLVCNYNQNVLLNTFAHSLYDNKDNSFNTEGLHVLSLKFGNSR